jgi:hypothetical protein
MKSKFNQITKSAYFILIFLTLLNCQKEKINSEVIVKEKKVIFYLDNEVIEENDQRLLDEIPATHVFLSPDNETEYNYSFSEIEKYSEFLKTKGYSDLEIKKFTSTEANFKAVNPSLMTITAYTDLNRNNFLAVFTANTTTCGQTWENQILGMKVEAASTACQTGQVPATIKLWNGCSYSGAFMNISLARCQSGTRYQYAIAPSHFRNWYNKSPRQIVSSWQYF